MYPKIVVMGEKKRQIPATMQAKAKIRTTFVKHSDFSTALSKICSFVRNSSCTSNSISMGFNIYE
jgi:hypothetical protein